MSKSFFTTSLLVLGTSLCAFEIDPWLSPVYEFEFNPLYSYSYFKRVQRGTNPHTHSHQHLIGASLGVALTENWDNQLEFEVADTPYFSWSLRSGALQSRYLFLNDLLGDPLSWTAGFSLRGSPSHNLSDLNSPYHGQLDAELNTAFGREWSRGDRWGMRTFLFAAVGMANRGYPWTRAKASFEGSFCLSHQYQLFVDTQLGFGPRHTVNTTHFTGYGKIHHQSIDVGLAYRYAFTLWGTVAVEYARRIFARSYPEQVNCFTIRYFLPFSLL